MKNLNQDQDTKYLRAKSRVEKLRGFYGHLTAYVLVNLILLISKIVRNMSHGETFQEAFFDVSLFGVWFFWGIGLAIHAFATFGMDYILGKDWEGKRIQKYMDEENNNVNF
jgi:hypothetical protein